MKDTMKRLKIYSLKNNRKQILNNYYSKEMRKGKTCRANSMDKLLFSLFFFATLLIFLIYKSQKILLSLFISLLFTFFLSKVFVAINKKIQDKKIKGINEELKQKKIIKNFDDCSREDFVNKIKDILEEHIKVKIDDWDSPMDLKCKINGKTYGIRCLQSSPEYRISSRELGIFIRELKEKGIENGLFVTNSYFIDKERYKERIILYDFDDIIGILKDIDKYPNDLEVENYIIDRFLDRRNSIKKEVKKLDTKKIIQLYIMALVFYFMSYFVKYDLYYKIIAIASFIVATGIGGYNISEHIAIKTK